MTQNQIFEGSSRVLEMSGAQVSYTPLFLPMDEADQIQRELTADIDWEQPRIKMFGREVLSPRLHGWYGDDQVEYRWSGRCWKTKPWTHALQRLTDRISAFTNCTYNSCLVNRYRNGRDSMGLHADDEPELGEEPTIASLSLGVTRDFEFRHRTDSSKRVSIALESGSLLVMAGTTQTFWKHQLPKRLRITEERLNLTFRNIETPRSA